MNREILFKTKKEMYLKEFIDKINKEQLDSKNYNFYMVVEDEKYEIEPVYDIYNYVHELIFKEDGDEITSMFNLTDIVIAKYLIKEVK